MIPVLLLIYYFIILDLDNEIEAVDRGETSAELCMSLSLTLLPFLLVIQRAIL